MITESNKIVILEYDKPVDITDLNPKEAGIWKWTMTTGEVIVTDDQGETGYFDWNNAIKYIVKSVKYGDLDLSRMTSYEDCKITDASFYYDIDTTEISFHFPDFEPPLDTQIYIGGAVGVITSDNNGAYYNSKYYDVRLKNVTAINKSVDPLFFGRIKTPDVNVKLLNHDGYYDDWRDLNLFGQKARILSGDVGQEYEDFTQHYEGNISKDSSDWKYHNVSLIDPRGALTQPVARNMLTVDDYPDLEDSNIDIPKPVAYGVILNAPVILLNGEDSGRTIDEYLFADTEFNNVTSIDDVYDAEGVTLSTVTEDLTAGTFTVLTSDVTADVLIDFTMPFSNGVQIIKDLMYRYDGKTFLSSFWDLAEVNLAETQSWNTSLYIDDKSVELRRAIEQVASDISGRFFNKNNGLYTIRIFDENRTTVKQIYFDDWGKGDPKKTGDSEEFLTSCIIEYNHRLDEDTYDSYENNTYEATTFSNYKTYKVKAFPTEITDYAGAVAKSEDVMALSKSVKDIVTRPVLFSVGEDLEIADFVVASPFTRVGETEDFGVWQVLGFTKDVQKATDIKLTIQYIKDYDEAAEPDYFVLLDDTNVPLLTDIETNFIGL